MQFLNLRETALEYWKHALNKRIELNIPKCVHMSQLEYFKNIIEFTTIEELEYLSNETAKITSQLIQIRLIGMGERWLTTLTNAYIFYHFYNLAISELYFFF